MEKKLFIHIGRVKTGTTSIQQFLSGSAGALRENGFKYANTGFHHKTLTHHPLAWSIVKYLHDSGLGGRYWNHTSRYAKPEKSDEAYWEQLRQEILQGDLQNHIISSEEFSVHGDPPTVSRIKALIGGDIKVIVICFLRSQDRYLESVYNQAVKGEENRTARKFADYIQGMIERKEADFNEAIDPWATEFGKENLRIIDFDCARKRGSIIDAFLDVIGWEGARENLEFGIYANRSLSRNQIRFLRILNKYKKTIDKEIFCRIVGCFSRINRYFDVDTRFLTDAEREDIKRIFRSSNEWFMKKYKDQMWKPKGGNPPDMVLENRMPGDTGNGSGI